MKHIFINKNQKQFLKNLDITFLDFYSDKFLKYFEDLGQSANNIGRLRNILLREKEYYSEGNSRSNFVQKSNTLMQLFDYISLINELYVYHSTINDDILISLGKTKLPSDKDYKEILFDINNTEHQNLLIKFFITGNSFNKNVNVFNKDVLSYISTIFPNENSVSFQLLNNTNYIFDFNNNNGFLSFNEFSHKFLKTLRDDSFTSFVHDSQHYLIKNINVERCVNNFISNNIISHNSDSNYNDYNFINDLKSKIILRKFQEQKINALLNKKDLKYYNLFLLSPHISQKNKDVFIESYNNLIESQTSDSLEHNEFRLFVLINSFQDDSSYNNEFLNLSGTKSFNKYFIDKYSQTGNVLLMEELKKLSFDNKSIKIILDQIIQYKALNSNEVFSSVKKQHSYLFQINKKEFLSSIKLLDWKAVKYILGSTDKSKLIFQNDKDDIYIGFISPNELKNFKEQDFILSITKSLNDISSRLSHNESYPCYQHSELNNDLDIINKNLREYYLKHFVNEKDVLSTKRKI